MGYSTIHNITCEQKNSEITATTQYQNDDTKIQKPASVAMAAIDSIDTCEVGTSALNLCANPR